MLAIWEQLETIGSDERLPYVWPEQFALPAFCHICPGHIEVFRPSNTRTISSRMPARVFSPLRPYPTIILNHGRFVDEARLDGASKVVLPEKVDDNKKVEGYTKQLPS